MTTRFRLPLIALALSLPVPLVAQQAQDFSLPPAPTPTASPRAQGPVDEEGSVVPIRPRVIQTGTPAPASTPTVTPTAVPTRQPAPATASPTVTPRRQTVVPSERSGATAQPARVATPLQPQSDVPPAQPQEGVGSIAAPPTAPQTGQANEPEENAIGDDSMDWTWLALLGGVLALIAGAFVFWRRKQVNAAPPEIERPVVAAVPSRAALSLADALAIRCEAEKLTRSAVYATLKYRLTLVNRTDFALSDVTIGVDLVSAHAQSPMEDQVATLATTLETRHTLPRIAPNQNLTVEGQVQLPLAGAQVIFQGQHPLLVPLMRVRVDGAGEGALVKTFVVGQGLPDGGRVQPFRLDEAPRSYAPIAHRELA